MKRTGGYSTQIVRDNADDPEVMQLLIASTRVSSKGQQRVLGALAEHVGGGSGESEGHFSSRDDS